MNSTHFDRLAQLAISSRRSLVGGAIALGAGWLGAPASDAKKRKRKRKKTCGKAGGAPVRGRCCQSAVAVDGVCRACDVCISGCDFAKVQAAIDVASDGATIVVCPGTYTENLSIARDVRIVGAGDGAGTSATILRGTGATSVVKTKAANVALQDLQITGGRGDGGGIFNLGARLDVIGCTVSGNTDPGASGGGIYNLSGTVQLIESTVSENESAFGGGIYNFGRSARVQLTNSEVRGNAAGDGGGIYVLDGADLRFDAASRVTGNRARSNGGGLFVSQTASRVTLASTDNVSGNTPTNCGGTRVDLCSGAGGTR